MVLNLHTSYAVEKAYNDMKESVSRLASPEGFEGVTVQPMISLKGYEIILGTWAKWWDGVGTRVGTQGTQVFHKVQKGGEYHEVSKLNPVAVGLLRSGFMCSGFQIESCNFRHFRLFKSSKLCCQWGPQ